MRAVVLARAMPLDEFMSSIMRTYETADNLTHETFKEKYLRCMVEFERKYQEIHIVHLFSFAQRFKYVRPIMKFGYLYQAVYNRMGLTDCHPFFALVTAPTQPLNIFWIVTAVIHIQFAANLTQDCLCEDTIQFMLTNPLALTCFKKQGKCVPIIEMFRQQAPNKVKALFPHGVPPRAELDMDTEKWSRLLKAYRHHCRDIRNPVWKVPARLCVWCGIAFVSNCAYRVMVHDGKSTTDDLICDVFNDSITRARGKIGMITVAESVVTSEQCVAGVVYPDVLLERYYDAADLTTARGPKWAGWEEAEAFLEQPPPTTDSDDEETDANGTFSGHRATTTAASSQEEE
jgi:hypothetical protein